MIINKYINNFKLFGEKEDFDLVIDNIEKSVPFKGTNLWILIFAIFIASLGLNVNSTAVIIGAMLISPLMGPIMGIGLSLGTNDLSLLRKSIQNYLFALVVGLITSAIYFFLSPINTAYSEILARTQPNIYDVLIAFFGGLAGVLAYSSKQKGNVIPGVAIATALMPPLCTAGYGLATLQWNFFFGAFYLFLINTVFIALSTLITVKYLRFPVKHLLNQKDELRNKRIIWAITLLTIIPSIYFGYNFIQDNRFVTKANSFIETEAKLPNEYLLNKKIEANKRKLTLTYGGAKLTKDDLNYLNSNFKKFGFGKNATLEIHQGFSYLDDVENKNSSNQILTQKDALIMSLQNKYDSLLQVNFLGKSIFNEMKIIYPEVDAVSLTKAINNTINSSNPITYCILNAKKPIDANQLKIIKNWLKVRLTADSLEVLLK
jgi:uncharacterized hydrophobic protein (TIGR00271 family)